MLNENNRMLEEEQSILDSLIREMDAEILRQDHMLTSAKLEEKKAKDKCFRIPMECLCNRMMIV